MFKKIRDIDVSREESWCGHTFLTFDIDWAHDEVIGYAIDILELHDVSATFFVTHDTPMLSRLKENPAFELGIHPNFNFLLQGDDRSGRTAEEVIDRLLAVVPEAKSVRSHSMTQSSRLLELFSQKGLTHDCNTFIPSTLKIDLIPWKDWNGVVRVPYTWEDDLAWFYLDEDVGGHKKGGLRVYDFHPIHLYLNTSGLDVYENSRKVHGVPAELEKFRRKGDGAFSTLEKLINAGRAVD